MLKVDDRRYRLKGLASAEVAIYHKNGNRIHFKNDGTVTIGNGSGEVALALKSDVDELRTKFNAHTHAHPADGVMIPATTGTADAMVGTTILKAE